MIAFASYPLQAQDVIVYTHYENPYKSSTKTSDEKEEALPTKPSERQTRSNSATCYPVGNFLNVNHKLPKNSSKKIYDDKGVQFLVGRLTVNGVIPVKSLSKRTYKLHLNDKPILWFIKN